MPMMQPPINNHWPTVHRYKKHDHKSKVHFNKKLLKPDPNFVDERKVDTKKDEEGFFSKLFGL